MAILLTLLVLASAASARAQFDGTPSPSTTVVTSPPPRPLTFERCRYKDRTIRSTGIFCYMCIVTILQLDIDRLIEVDRKRNRTFLEKLCSLEGRGSCIDNIDACCEAAERCCHQQHHLEAALGEGYREFCPATWDDLSCINVTAPHQKAKIQCPSYAPNFQSNAFAVSRYCQPNATWILSTVNDYSWEKTDYGPCVFSASYLDRVKVIILLVLNCISLFLLAVSLILFLSIRSLRWEKRIQVHANLFFSMLGQYILKSFIVVADMQQYGLTKVEQSNGIYQMLGFCRFLTIGNRIFISATYTWYVCEAIFLYRQLNRAFDNIMSLKFFYLAGWGIPFVVNAIYCLVRFFIPSEEVSKSSELCWLNDLPYLELIHRGPILLGLLINFCFLGYILYVVLNLHEVHGNRSSHKRSLKAALILAPLFGLNFTFVMVHWDNMVYAILHSVIEGSQGSIVAIIFCFRNHEVRAAFEANRRRYSNKWLSNRSTSRGGSTQYTAVSQSHGRSNGSVISAAAADSLPLASLGKNPSSTPTASVFQKL